MAEEQPNLLQTGDSLDLPEESDSLFNRVFSEIIPGGAVALQSIKEKVAAQGTKFAERLIDQGDKRLKDPGASPAEIKGIYQTALGIQQIFVPTKNLISTLDRLSDQSQGAEAIKYREKALAIERAHTNNPIALAARHTELAGRYAEIKDFEHCAKHFDMATIFWQNSRSHLTEERLGDAALLNGAPEQASKAYAKALSELNHELSTHYSRKIASSSPLEAELNKKMADSILAMGTTKFENMNEASRRYQLAADRLNEYGRNFGKEKILPEELEALAAAIKVECQLASYGSLPEGNNPANIEEKDRLIAELREDHTRNAAELLITLSDRENRCQMPIQGNKGNNYGQIDSCLLPKLTEIADLLAADRNFKESAGVWDRVYSMRTAQGKPATTRINALEKASEQYFQNARIWAPVREAPENSVALANNALKQIIKIAEKEYKNNYPQMVAVIQNVVTHCRENGFNRGAAETQERLYSIQTAQGKSTEDRLTTLESAAEEYFQAEMKTKGGNVTSQIIELARKEYGEQDPRLISTIQDVATICSNNKAYQYEVQALETLYSLRANKLNTQEKVEALKQIIDSYCVADKFGKAIETYEKIIQLVGNDKNLYPLLQAPESIYNLLEPTQPLLFDAKPEAEQAKVPNQLYRISNQLKRAADLQDTHEPTQPMASKNYLNAMKAINESLKRGLPMDLTVASSILDLLSIESKRKGPFEGAIVDGQKRLELIREVPEKVFDWIAKDLAKNGAPLVSKLDQVGRQFIEQKYASTGVSFLRLSLAIVQATPGSEADDKITERIKELVRAYESYQYQLGVKDANEMLFEHASKIKDYKTALETLHSIADTLQYPPRDRSRDAGLDFGFNARREGEAERTARLQEALRYRDLEITKVAEWKKEDIDYRASLLKDKANIQVDLDQKREATVTLQEALKLNENQRDILRDELALTTLVMLYEEMKEPRQALDLLQKAIDKCKKDERVDQSVQFYARRSGILERQGNMDAAKKELINSLTLARSALEKVAPGDKKENAASVNGSNKQLLSAYYNLAAFYMRNEQYANAEPVLRDLIKAYEAAPIDFLTKMELNGYWNSLATVCEKQGHLKEAEQAREAAKKYKD